MSRRWIAPLLVLAAALCPAACDTASSDFDELAGGFSMPTPAEAGRWAVDPYNAENQRRGTLLLSNAPWGGTEAYRKMYRFYVSDNRDPLVRAAALEALGHHGDASDAEVAARCLKDKSEQVRVAAARALQRLHDPKVTGEICSRLIDEAEESSVRVELALALGQYPSDDAFQALVATLDARELAVNLAALDSLHLLTDQDFGLDRPLWLSWYRSTRTPFRRQLQYLYPTFQRHKGFWDHVCFWKPLTFEMPGVPTGMQEPAGAPPRQPFGNVGEGKAAEAKGAP